MLQTTIKTNEVDLYTLTTKDAHNTWLSLKKKIIENVITQAPKLN